MLLHGCQRLLRLVPVCRQEQQQLLGVEIVPIVFAIALGLQVGHQLSHFLLLEIVVLDLTIEVNARAIGLIKSDLLLLLWVRWGVLSGKKR